MAPFAPGLFSTTPGCPSTSWNFDAIARATMSEEPPATNGTITLIGLVGNACAAAFSNEKTRDTARTTPAKDFIFVPPRPSLLVSPRGASPGRKPQALCRAVDFPPKRRNHGTQTVSRHRRRARLRLARPCPVATERSLSGPVDQGDRSQLQSLPARARESRAHRLRHALVRRPGLVRRRPLSAVERHPEQPHH